MTGISAPATGLIGLTQIHGDVGELIRIGQWLNGDGFKQWEHAFVSLGAGLIVEAEPGGARIGNADEYSAIHWCYGIAKLATPDQLQAVADAARKYAGVPYSFLDYAELAAHRLHIPVPGLKTFIGDSKHLICSQLCDQAEQDAGIHLFKDGRWPGFVTPADLFNLDVTLTPGE
jgi:hypothetical protein